MIVLCDIFANYTEKWNNSELRPVDDFCREGKIHEYPAGQKSSKIAHITRDPSFIALLDMNSNDGHIYNPL